MGRVTFRGRVGGPTGEVVHGGRVAFRGRVVAKHATMVRYVSVVWWQTSHSTYY